MISLFEEGSYKVDSTIGSPLKDGVVRIDFKVKNQGKYYLSTRFDETKHKNRRVYINVTTAQASMTHSQCYIKAIENKAVNIEGTQNIKMQNDQVLTYKCDIRNNNGVLLDASSFEVIAKDNKMLCEVKRLDHHGKEFPSVRLDNQRLGVGFFECDYKFIDIGTFEINGYLENSSGRQVINAKSNIHNRIIVLAYPKDFTNARFYDFKLNVFQSNSDILDVRFFINLA